MKPIIQPMGAGPGTAPGALLPSPWAHAIHKPIFISFLICFIGHWTALLLGITNDWPWLEGLFWALAALTALVGLARRLPEQNILILSLFILAMALVIAAISDKTGVPFGPRLYTERLGQKILGVPWPVPLIWMVVVICGRGVARLILRPWRKTTYYGFWVIGLTCLLALCFDLGLEPFATRVKHYWFWQTSGNVLAWYSAPWVNFLGWLAATVAILGFVTPWLINKQPVKQPTDHHPLVLWLLLNFYFATSHVLHQMWVAAACTVLTSVIATFYAVRGARW